MLLVWSEGFYRENRDRPKLEGERMNKSIAITPIFGLIELFPVPEIGPMISSLESIRSISTMTGAS